MIPKKKTGHDQRRTTLGPLGRLLTNPRETHVPAGLNGKMQGVQKRKERRYATQQPNYVDSSKWGLEPTQTHTDCSVLQPPRNKTLKLFRKGKIIPAQTPNSMGRNKWAE